MSSMKALGFVLFVFWGLSSFAQKTIMDGNTLDDACRFAEKVGSGSDTSTKEFGEGMFCAGYVRGVLDDVWMQQKVPEAMGLKTSGSLNTCISDSVSNSQAVKVVIKYLHDNPARLQLPAGALIRLALANAFPCK